MAMTTQARRLGPADGTVLIEADGVTKTFDTLEGPLPVLEGVSLQVRAGEIVALLGKSGSGKSTLLRCVAGLIAPSGGTVAYRGSPLVGANPGAAMVFPTFALLPWLTVRGVPAHVDRRARHRLALRRSGWSTLVRTGCCGCGPTSAVSHAGDNPAIGAAQPE